MMKRYIPQLDYLKSLFILLMILFHLVYISDTYPYLKRVVYTFHVPIFLILSGYLSGTDKSVKQFSVSLWGLFFPYSIMELGYVLAGSFLPVREQMGDLSIANIFRRIFIDPAGPYWYLHTLLLCRIVHYFIGNLFKERVGNLALLILIGLGFWGVSQGLGLMWLPHSMFFLIGVAISLFKLDFLKLFSPSPLSGAVAVILCCYPDNIGGFSLPGVVIVYSVISLLLWIYPLLPAAVARFSLFIGRNTLCLLLFSPIFTMASRFYLPYFMFDPTGICFALFTLVFAVAGCLAITWCMDKLNISPWFFGQKRMLKSCL